jgi:hypothetical protein
MTTAIVVLIGAGIILIVSAIENAPIIDTFLAVWSGKPLSSLGPNSTDSTPANNSTTTLPAGNNPPTLKPL